MGAVVEYDLKAAQQRMNKAKPDYNPQTAKWRKEQAIQAKVREIRKMKKLLEDEK